MAKQIEKIIPGFIIFMTGFITMAFEIIGSRVLGPYFGSSVFVWTSLIGIIMGSLSVGYWFGGLISVRRSAFYDLMLILSISALFVLITATSNVYILDRVVKYMPGLRLQTVVGSIILFGPASIGFGMVLPYGIKMRIENVVSSGGTVGDLYALSTVGSILGTFSAGFFLVPVFGFANVLFILPASMILISLPILAVRISFIPVFITVLVTALVVIFWIRENNKEFDYVDTDTQYSRVIIYDTKDWKTGRPIKMLRVNDENSSAMFLDQDDDLVFDLLKFYRLSGHLVPGYKSALMIGGSGYAFPKDFLSRNKDVTLDVVEIDPGMTALARKYFNLKDHPNLRIYHEDGRVFLNRNIKKYDLVFIDAFKSMLTIPFQLTTQEAVMKVYNSLNDEGAVLVNVISSLNAETGKFMEAELATYRSVFPQVLLFAVQYPDPTEEEKEYLQNFMLVGLKSDKPVRLESTNAEYNSYLTHYYPMEVPPGTAVLTDEYAPVEFFASRALK